LDEHEVDAAFADFVGLSRREVAVGLMRRFRLEDAARGRMEEFGVDKPWQAYGRIRLRNYESLLSDPECVRSVRYPHNLALLRDVRRQGYPTALATQSHREEALRVLEILGVRDEFDVIATREDVEHGKPDPEMHLLVARELGIEPGDYLAVEDSPTGIEAALAAGAQAIAVTTELTRKKFRDSDLLDRSHVVDDPPNLASLVQGLTG
jgi:HAD superfamily hydrolase (TIGR01509 family)